MDKKQKRLNWPGVAAALREIDRMYLNRDNKASMRKYYVDGIPCKFDAGPALERPLQILAKIILEPESTKADWKRWIEDDELGFPYRPAYYKSDYIHFGENTVLNGRDNEVFEILFPFKPEQYSFGELEPVSKSEVRALRRIGITVDPAESEKMSVASTTADLEYQLRPAITHLGQFKPSKHGLNWRFTENYIIALQTKESLNFDLIRGTREEYVDQLQHYICAIEWAHRYADCFDPTIKPVVEMLREGLFTETPHQSLRQVYERSLEERLEEYAELSGAGGSLYMCIEFDTNEQLEAMKTVLNPETRYPYGDDNPTETVRSIPPLRGRELRISHLLITNLWRLGFSAKRIEILSANTLFVETTAPILLPYMYRALDWMTTDAINIRERIEERKTPDNDHMRNETCAGKMVYLIKPLKGRWRAGAKKRYLGDLDEDQEYGYSEVWQNVDSDIDDIVENGIDDPSSFMDLLLEKYELIRERGEPYPLHQELEDSSKWHVES